MTAPSLDAPWAPLAPREIADLFTGIDARWWISGGAALDLVVGAPIRERDNVDISTIPSALEAVVAALPAHYELWAPDGDEAIKPYVPAHEDIQPLRVWDTTAHVWTLQINVEDGAPAAWVYKRDPRLQLPWPQAVIDVDGIPVGAPEVQLIWKSLRPRPADTIDKDAVLPHLSDDQKAVWEKALWRIHPHSGWTIPVRSPFAPAKASWNKKPVEG